MIVYCKRKKTIFLLTEGWQQFFWKYYLRQFCQIQSLAIKSYTTCKNNNKNNNDTNIDNDKNVNNNHDYN